MPVTRTNWKLSKKTKIDKGIAVIFDTSGQKFSRYVMTEKTTIRKLVLYYCLKPNLNFMLSKLTFVNVPYVKCMVLIQDVKQ